MGKIDVKGAITAILFIAVSSVAILVGVVSMIVDSCIYDFTGYHVFEGHEEDTWSKRSYDWCDDWCYEWYAQEDDERVGPQITFSSFHEYTIDPLCWACAGFKKDKNDRWIKAEKDQKACQKLELWRSRTNEDEYDQDLRAMACKCLDKINAREIRPAPTEENDRLYFYRSGKAREHRQKRD